MISLKPMMEFSGVRNSCDIVARKTSLMRFEASAWSRATVSSCVRSFDDSLEFIVHRTEAGLTRGEPEMLARAFVHVAPDVHRADHLAGSVANRAVGRLVINPLAVHVAVLARFHELFTADRASKTLQRRPEVFGDNRQHLGHGLPNRDLRAVNPFDFARKRRVESNEPVLRIDRGQLVGRRIDDTAQLVLAAFRVAQRILQPLLAGDIPECRRSRVRSGLGQVTKCDHDTGDPVVGRSDRRTGTGYAALRAIARDELRVRREFLGTAFANDVLERDADRCSIVLIDQRQHIIDGLAARVRLRPARQRGGHRIQASYSSVLSAVMTASPMLASVLRNISASRRCACSSRDSSR